MIEYRIAGIPCLIDVVSFSHVQGSYSYNAASDMDYYGYSDIEYTVHDRKGYLAPWLAKKITDEINQDIERMIFDDFMQKRNEAREEHEVLMYDYD
jgi:hypothetical protein